ncbi:MAG: large conductance mechanosensitive channel protein MscL [Ruminococcaceae bacterium]|nr:large conductance mechanosensitive channel protein MscL [Oscillospiraceae bacterium]
MEKTKMKKFFGEFKEFIAKGNVMDLAIGMVIGSTFTKIVNSMVNDILMPLVSLLTGKTNFANMFIALDGNDYMTLAEAQEAGATVIAYGNLIELIINFILTALFLFIIVKALNKLRSMKEKEEEAK